MRLEEYARHDGLGLAARVRDGEVSPEELRSCALEAIEARNPALNAVLEVLERESREALAGGLPRGPFHGVPFAIKELVLQAQGVPCRMGSRLAAALRGPADSELMRRFRAAGLLLVATTQTPELGYCATTEPVAYGPVHNPWRTGVSAGGSSGGSGAAVAAGLVPLAHANDGGGSIRIPASANGLVGLKPTRDRVPTGPDYADPLFGHAIEFAVTRSVRDSAALLDAVAGPDVGAPHLIAPPRKGFAAALARPAPRLRVCVASDSFFGAAPDAACVAAVERARELLAGLGHELRDEPPPRFDWDEFCEHINVIWCAFVASGVEGLRKAVGKAPSPENLEAVTRSCAEFGRGLPALALVAALDYGNRVSRELGRWFEGLDVLVTPTLAAPPPAHGVIDQDDASLSALEWTQRTFRYAPYTPFFNVTGQPAISLPLHVSPQGLPIGVQLAGRMGDEETLLALSHDLEQAAPWADRLPAPA